MSAYFPKPKFLGANMKVELDLSNYATKSDLKNATEVDASDFAKSTDLAHLKYDVDKLDTVKLKNVPSYLSHLKSKVDKLDIGKLETTPVDLSKLSNVVKNDVIKKAEYNELVKKVNNISTTGTSNLLKKTDYNTKIREIEKKITTDHSKYSTAQEFNKLTSESFAARLAQANLATKTDIPDITDFVKKADFENKLISFQKRITSNKTRAIKIKN